MTYKTQFPGIGYTNVVGTQVGYMTESGKKGKGRNVNEWRFVDVETGSLIGPRYPSRVSLLADATRYCTEYGCIAAF